MNGGKLELEMRVASQQIVGKRCGVGASGADVTSGVLLSRYNKAMRFLWRDAWPLMFYKKEGEPGYKPGYVGRAGYLRRSGDGACRSAIYLRCTLPYHLVGP